MTEEEVVNFFKEHRVITWEQLTSRFGITRQALQRKIENHPHLTSLNHNHGYLALRQSIGKTDQHGIWTYKGIVFSVHGNTAKTAVHLIHNGDRGLTATQLEQITSVKCRGILLKLLKQGKVTRIKEGFDYIYLSSKAEVRRAQLENGGLASQEPLVEARTHRPSEEPEEIPNLLDLGEDDYVLRRLEMVRRVRSGKSKAQVAREMDCTPETVRSTCRRFDEQGAKGLVITRKKPPHKMTESTKIEILIEKAKHPEWSSEKIGEALRKRGRDIGDRSIRAYLEGAGLVGQKKTWRRS